MELRPLGVVCVSGRAHRHPGVFVGPRAATSSRLSAHRLSESPRTVLPFVVEHAGGINKGGVQFFRMCRDAANSKLNTRASGLSSWSSTGFSNFFLQSLSLANLKGLGNLCMVTAASIRAA